MKIICSAVVLFVISFYSCKERISSNTELLSEDYDNRAERVEKLGEEVIFFSPVTDAEFKLVNVNGFHNKRLTVPGPSYWDYKFAVKINPSDISKWKAGMTDTSILNYNEDWLSKIVSHRKENWMINKQSRPKFYIRKGENVTTIIFEKEGIVYKSVTNY